ncbi:(2Fe-2S)-binding protein [Oscillochloris sp. ZM17-4]|uniref:2Fe-2S iron-sulfur cluster-binding protein n=1 Tax=Oscillochloris sp. ZM17-4 TaxID=2866714 RepID=UPI001C731540|nr:2Fe-2S iron-sulfur cluster-binding protein [Oscillochloris sp. ZM17-4]MBX0327338.1 (2Fe-2S)-binding protein [Oscillochloris sp. ZM17-4]
MLIKVEINDEVVEAQLGERLLDIARRNASHIGFYCDGNGLCTMCECKVLSGADQLNPPNATEHVWLSEERLADGYRLGCQAALRGAKPVQVLTRAEEMRRQFNAVMAPPAGTNAADNLRPLLANIAAVNWQHIGRWPFNLLSSMRRLGLLTVLWPVTDMKQLIDDTVRITRRQSAPERALSAPPKALPAPNDQA